MIEIILDGEVPMTWNKLYAGSHWSVRKNEAERVHDLVYYSVMEQVDPELRESLFPLTGVDITVTAYISDGRVLKDPCNLPAKIYIDGLVEAGVIEDDNWKIVNSVTTARRNCDRRDRVEIGIE